MPSDRTKLNTKGVEDDLPDIEWRKVGKIYESNAEIDGVIAKEVERLHKAFDIKITE